MEMKSHAKSYIIGDAGLDSILDDEKLHEDVLKYIHGNFEAITDITLEDAYISEDFQECVFDGQISEFFGVQQQNELEFFAARVDAL